MSKIKLKAILNTPENKIEYEVEGVLKDNKLIYNEKDKLNTLVTYDYVMNCLERENAELHMTYLFKENIITKGLLEIKDLNKTVEVLLKTKSINQEKFNLEISFLVENKPFTYILKGKIIWVLLKN